ncbi:MAG: hypothetical protein KBD54_00605 [Candidatus Pacebacteria bacterium]|nr:hypothetical protein [Candidatus Paceibacterota bacterium]
MYLRLLIAFLAFATFRLWLPDPSEMPNPAFEMQTPLTWCMGAIGAVFIISFGIDMYFKIRNKRFKKI